MLKSVIAGLLLLSVVDFVVVGSGVALSGTMVLAWALFPALVGFGNALEAGCVFMLIPVGALVVGVAERGLGHLLP